MLRGRNDRRTSVDSGAVDGGGQCAATDSVLSLENYDSVDAVSGQPVGRRQSREPPTDDSDLNVVRHASSFSRDST